MSEPAPFCAQCGDSLVPLRVPHVSRACDQCEKTKHLAEPGSDGKGFRVDAGDSIHIPDGWLRFSLDPAKTNGRFSKAGTIWFVSHMLTGDLPRTPADLSQYLSRCESHADDVLHASDRLAHLDLMDPEQASAALELLQQHKESAEWTAAVVEILRGTLADQLAEGADTQVVVHALALQAQRSLLLYKQHLADLVWTGYEQVRAVYDLAAATAHTPAEAESIRALEPAFRRLDEATLFAWVDAEADVGKKMNVAGLDPAVLLSLARYHLSLREREREQGRWEADRLIRLGEYKIKLWQLMLGVGGFGVLVGGTIGGLIGG